MIWSSFINLHFGAAANKVVRWAQQSVMNKQSQSEGSAPPLPTPQDAIRHCLQAYFQATLDRVVVYFGEVRRSKYYSELSNQEIFRRGHFLTYFYEALMALHALALPGRNQPFRLFLNSLVFTTDDFTKITRIHNDCILENQTTLNQRILALLYETEFYIYQILLRVVLLKLAFEEQERAVAEIEALSRNCMFPQYFPVDRKTLTKRERSRLKQIISDVGSMLNCYHLELSMNRSECISRPEANCLVHLLRSKLSKPLFEFVQEHIKFKCEGVLPPQLSYQSKIPIMKPEAIIAQSKSHLPNPPQSPPTPKEVLPNKTIPQKESLQQQQRPNDTYEPHPSPQQLMHFEVEPSPILRPLSNLFIPPASGLDKERVEEERPPPNEPSLIKQYPPQMLQTPKKNKFFKRPPNLLIEEHRKDSDSVSKKSEDIIESNLPEFRYDRHLHPRTPSQKPKKNSKQISLKEQLKAPKRFAHAQCNLRYVTKFKKNSRREKEKMLTGQLHFNTNPAPIPNNYYVRPPRKQEESDESYLAEETPVYRSRAGMQSDNLH